MKIFFNLVFVLLVAGLFSCQSDDDFVPGPAGLSDDDKFELKINDPFDDYFIIASTGGQIILDTILESSVESLLINFHKSQRLTITHGISDNSFSRLRTFVNVKSGFEVKDNLIVRCDDAFESTNYNLITDLFRLYVDNLANYADIYSSFGVDHQINFDPALSQLFIQGRNASETDYVITIRKDMADFKSYYIKHEDWVLEDDYLTLHIDYNDFQESIPRIIPTQVQMSAWYFSLHAFQSNNRVVRLANWTNPNEFHNDTQIRYFLTPGLEMNKYKVGIDALESGAKTFGFYHNALDEIAFNFVEYSPNFALSGIQKDNYAFSLTNNVDLVILTYEFLEPPTHRAVWSIYHLASPTVEFDLDIISDEIFDNFPDLRSVLQLVNGVDVTAYDFEGDVDDAFHESGIDHQLNCFPHSKKIFNKEF